jgi:hypothetical protein
MSREDLEGEDESEIITAQDQVLQTKYHVTRILKTETIHEETLYSVCSTTL